MNTAEAKQTLAEFFRYLDVVEESDSGKPFRPNFISSCRVMDGMAMDKLLKELKQWISDPS